MKIKIVGIDPALRNFGLAVGVYDTDTQQIDDVQVSLIKTASDSSAKKTVRKSSDDLRCATEMFKGVQGFIRLHGPALLTAEVPSGCQSARGSLSNGVCIGILGALPNNMIQVNPTEVKLASVGDKKASKAQMIAWAVGKWPQAGWRTKTIKGVTSLVDDNEHMADACAALAACVQTDQFAQLVAVLESQKEAA